MKATELMDLKKSLLQDLLKQMDGGIVSSMKPVKAKSELIIIGKPAAEGEDPEETMGEDGEEQAEQPGEMADSETASDDKSEDESDIQKKLRQLFSNM